MHFLEGTRISRRYFIEISKEDDLNEEACTPGDNAKTNSSYSVCYFVLKHAKG